MAVVVVPTQVSRLATLFVAGVALAACGTATPQQLAAQPSRVSHVEKSPSHSWSRERVLHFAALRLHLELQGHPAGAGLIEEKTALRAAKRFGNPNGPLAGTALAVVTAKTRFVHRPMWLAVFHVKEPKYSDVSVQPPGAPSPIITDNPMVDALMTFVVDAKTGEVQFAATR